MSDNHPPFVVRRPDGFIGVEVSVSDQLTAVEASSLGHQLIVLSQSVGKQQLIDQVCRLLHVHNAHPALEKDLVRLIEEALK